MVAVLMHSDMFVWWIRKAHLMIVWVVLAIALQPMAVRAAELEGPEVPEPVRIDPIENVSTGSSIEQVPVEDVPEEILRTEIITEARSPLTGEPLTAVEYAQLQAELAAPAGGNLVSEDIQYLIFLLQLRRAVSPIIPFFP